MTNFNPAALVREFHEWAGHPAPNAQYGVSITRQILRDQWTMDELAEGIDALTVIDFVGWVDSRMDAIYFLMGDLVEAGIDNLFPELFEAVHKANMSKRHDDGTFHFYDDGKINKSDNFTPPEDDIRAILEKDIEVRGEHREQQ